MNKERLKKEKRKDRIGEELGSCEAGQSLERQVVKQLARRINDSQRGQLGSGGNATSQSKVRGCSSLCAIHDLL